METQEILILSVSYLFIGSILLGLLHKDYDVSGLVSYMFFWPFLLIAQAAGIVRGIVMSVFG